MRWSKLVLPGVAERHFYAGGQNTNSPYDILAVKSNWDHQNTHKNIAHILIHVFQQRATKLRTGVYCFMRDVTDSTAPFFFKIPYPPEKKKTLVPCSIQSVCHKRWGQEGFPRCAVSQVLHLCQTPVPRFPAKRFSSTQSMKKILGSTLWLFNIAMENGKYIGDENPDLPSKHCDFPKQPVK